MNTHSKAKPLSPHTVPWHRGGHVSYAGPTQSPAKARRLPPEANSWLPYGRSREASGAPLRTGAAAFLPIGCVVAPHCASWAWPRPRSGLGYLRTTAGHGGLCATLSSQIPICPTSPACFSRVEGWEGPESKFCPRQGRSLRERDLAALLPFGEAKALGPGGLSRAWGFLRAQNGVGLGLELAVGRPRAGCDLVAGAGQHQLR